MITLEHGNIRDFFSSSEEKYFSKGELAVTNLLKKRKELGFIDVENTVSLENILGYVENVKDNFESVVVLWVGGSALWVKAVIEALRGKYHNEHPKYGGKKIYILDNIDGDSVADVLERIDITKTLFCFISKSGTTIEPSSQYLFFREKCREVCADDWKKHFCFIVWEQLPEKDMLAKDFQVFTIPENIGGRFSVFTAVGLVPLAFAGIDIAELLEAIREKRDTLLHTDMLQNPAAFLAIAQYYFSEEDHKNIAVFFPYTSRFFQVGEWYKQLLAESIGKNGKGITPVVSIGVTDQHSQLQLYQDGPKDKFCMFLELENSNKDFAVHKNIPGFTFNTLRTMAKFGTQTSLSNEGVPVCSLQIKNICEKSVAELLYLLELQVAYLWELFEINAFDQPGVEKSKVLTREKIQEKFGDIDIHNKVFYG